MWMLITIKDIREQLDRLHAMVCGGKTPNQIYKSVMNNHGAGGSIVEEQKPLEDDPDISNQLNTEMDNAVEDGSEEIDKYRRRIQDGL